MLLNTSSIGLLWFNYGLLIWSILVLRQWLMLHDLSLFSDSI